MPILYLPGDTTSKRGVRPTVRSLTKTSALVGTDRSNSFAACGPELLSSALRFTSAGGGPDVAIRFEDVFLASGVTGVSVTVIGGILTVCTAVEVFPLAVLYSAASCACEVLSVRPSETIRMPVFQLFCMPRRPTLASSPRTAQCLTLAPRQNLCRRNAKVLAM